MKTRKLASMTLLVSSISACGELDEALNPRQEETRQMLMLQPMPADPSNAWSEDPAAAVLGQKFFFDPRFSGPLGPENDRVTDGSLGHEGEVGKVACASCHDPARGGTDHRSQPGAVSLGAGYTGRNTPAVVNAAYSPVWQFWDGRTDSLWSQALGPLESAVEHNTTRLEVAHVIAEHYRAEYEAVFGAMPELENVARFPLSGKPQDPAFDAMPELDRDAVNRVFANFGKAVEAYERKLLCKDSPFDRWAEGDETAMTPLAIRGYKLFVGRAGCLECHNGGTFTDYRFHNIGVPRSTAVYHEEDRGRAHGIDSVKNSIFNRAGEFSDAPSSEHLNALTPGEEMEGQFKTPSLRCIELTAPYMHNGTYADLWEVVNHYRFGGATGNFPGHKDPAIRSLELSDSDLEALVEFLKSLTGSPLPEELVTRPVE